jgi:hypothetical protein
MCAYPADFKLNGEMSCSCYQRMFLRSDWEAGHLAVWRQGMFFLCQRCVHTCTSRALRVHVQSVFVEHTSQHKQPLGSLSGHDFWKMVAGL